MECRRIKLTLLSTPYFLLPTMQICIDVSPTAQKHAGLGRYAGEVARALSQKEKINLSLFYNRQGDAELPDYLNHISHKSVNIGNKPWRMGVWLSQLTHWPMDKTFGATEIFHATNLLLHSFQDFQLGLIPE